ncbi:MAG: glycosyltransferase family 2 protein [Eubacterium sp.]|nr:glycosyltransferase family 2 protein [Eubacterium sp.]
MGNGKALISVIVGVYNGQRYLGECLDSVLDQSYGNLEVIVVDDGSTDASPQIVDAYAKRDGRVVPIHQENKGVSAARNHAMNIASGEYICFLDQDDCLARDYVEYFYRLILESGAEIAITKTVKKFTGECHYSLDCEDLSDVVVWSGSEAAEQMLFYNVVIAPWNKMIRRDLIERNRLRFHKQFFGGEGFCFSVDCFQRADRVAVGSREVYYYRVDNAESGMTKFSLGIIKSSIQAQKRIYSDLVEKTDRMRLACRYANWHTHCDCLNMMVGCHAVSGHLGLYRQIKKVCRRRALTSLRAPIPKKEKIKGVCYFLSPFITACMINHFRMRKFTREQ